MNCLTLPLVELLVSSYKGPSLSNVRVIGVQHILETTHAMFRSLYRIGLRPENISIIGKCYSTCQEVYNEMIADGIDVSPDSFAYSSHLPYDQQFGTAVASFLSSRLEEINGKKFDRLIVLDDGGKCISALTETSATVPFSVAIEQTTSGYEAIRKQALRFPVINVARSPLKLSLESPMIAEAAAERLYLSLRKKNLSPKKALIIGGGAIGQAMRKKLAEDMETAIYDQNTRISHFQTSALAQLINTFPLIIGCTGTTSIPYSLHSNLSPYTALISASSSDREFDAVYLRKSLPENGSCHDDLIVNELLLVNSGFPVNFDGGRENIAPESIQLTIALITAAILQARELETDTFNSLLALRQDYSIKIEEEFLAANLRRT